MKKIICLAPYTFLPAKVGGQKAITSLYENLSRKFYLLCISTKGNDATKAKGYEVRKIFSNSSLRYINVFYFFILRRIIRKEKFDYLQIEHPYLGWMALLLKRFTGIRLIVRSHNIEGLRFRDLQKWWWKILLNYEGWVYRNSDYIFFITDTDRLHATNKLKVAPEKTFTITYGINRVTPPTEKEQQVARAQLIIKHKLSEKDVIILFNGAFSYKPNAEALHKLVTTIFPLVKTKTAGIFKLIVCGKDIPDTLINENTDPDIIFAGFVNEINLYLTGSDVFANPLIEGGGIKTKLVEALAFNLNCVTFENGAIGIPSDLCGNKLQIIKNNNDRIFAEAVINAASIIEDIPKVFFNYFSNEKIIKKITEIL